MRHATRLWTRIPERQGNAVGYYAIHPVHNAASQRRRGGRRDRRGRDRRGRDRRGRERQGGVRAPTPPSVRQGGRRGRTRGRHTQGGRCPRTNVANLPVQRSCWTGNQGRSGDPNIQRRV